MITGVRNDLPTGTVTFLFTDVEGSTTLLHSLGAGAYADALAEHRGIVRKACASESGAEVDTQGDAFFFAFASASGAVAAAQAMTEALAAGPIRLRIGLHTGTPLVTDEGYIGDDVHLAARVAAAGHGGQVVLSHATGALLDEPSLTDLGEHRLKDIDGAVSIFQLGSTRFPPLKTISNTNLPRPASSFVGRQAELVEIFALLEDGSRLVTLTGPGGSGKTRLALEAAATLVPSYKAGTFWVGLASLRDPSLVTATIAQTIGSANGLAEQIADREMLLLLDNLEHVIEVAPEISALLPACPNLTVLVTSRQLLRVQGEVEYEVPALASPEAVSLFCARSRLEPSEEIAELCAHLDDLPLALELAAARTKALSPKQILERLAERLDLLQGGRDADPRQQTLRATIEWSYDLLTAEEQRLFRALSAFAGGCTLKAVAGVADGQLDTLQSLVEKNLIRFSDERYWMLETIREYATDRIEHVGEAEQLSDRHADFFLDFAQRQGPLLESALQSEARQQLMHDESNLRLALTHAYHRSPGRLLEFVSALALYWTSAGQSTETQTWAERALESAHAEPTVLRADALLVLSLTASRVGDTVKSVACAHEAIDIYRVHGQRLGRALVYLANAHLRGGNYEEARLAFEDAIEYSERATDDWSRALALSNLGYLSLILGDYQTAERMSLEAVDLKRELGNEVGAMESLCNAGLAALLALRLEDARALLSDTLTASLELGQNTLIACSLEGFAWMRAGSSEFEHAARLQGAAERSMEAAGGSLDGVERRIHDETRAAIRSGLDQRCNEQLALGRSLGVDEAVALALEGLRPAPPLG